MVQDRDIEQRYATLLTLIQDLTKSFEVDIAADLDLCLDEFSQTPVTYQKGEASINFTQAAFLIPGGAFVYGKNQYVAHEEMALADNLPTPRQAARNQAVTAQNLFRKQRQRTISVVVFDTEKEIEIHE
ncbi:condensin-2 complex subunit H2-like [Haemaphysalis longicornis]